MPKANAIEKTYRDARERFAQIGVNTDSAMRTMRSIAISLNCWQGDDVSGFETPDAGLSGGGIQVTGNYPGRARNIAELQADAEMAFSLIPGLHRFNLHAIYGDFGTERIERNQVGPEHFESWIDWARKNKLELDFNSTCFSHPKADSGYTLSSKDRAIREFWIEHVKQCRAIGAHIGKELGGPCIHNVWLPDGSKDVPFDRWEHRQILRDSLDELFETQFPEEHMKDAVESKLFGIGSESYVVGSHEFYMGYGLSRGKMICLDMGHFHPTESVADKISAILPFADELLLHVSRSVRWDSDHVAVLNDELMALAHEVVRSGKMDRIHLALDFFDATVNRIAAWVIGMRATQKALLSALLSPSDQLKKAEDKKDYTARLAWADEQRLLPVGAVWDYWCLENSVPAGTDWLNEVRQYEAEVTSKRV